MKEKKRKKKKKQDYLVKNPSFFFVTSFFKLHLKNPELQILKKQNSIQGLLKYAWIIVKKLVHFTLQLFSHLIQAQNAFNRHELGFFFNFISSKKSAKAYANKTGFGPF